MVPATFTLLSELPANSNGKVDRNALPPPQAPAQPRPCVLDDQEAVLARLFGECLSLDGIPPDDDLLLLGLNSLSAANAAAQIKSVMGLQVTVTDIFRNPSVRRLGAALRTPRSAVPPVTPIPRAGRLPASFAQERLWVSEQINGPSTRYNIPVAIRMRGALDARALRAAVGDLVDRHEALRTKIVADRAGLRQEIMPAGFGVELQVTEEVSTADVERAVMDAARRPFDLGAEIPFRAHLFSCGDDWHVLLLLIHHIAVDGWSIKPLAKDLGFAYSTRLVGMAPPWRPLPVQYADYASWQRALFGEAHLSEPAVRQIDYWRAALRGAPELISLDTDRERPEVLSTRADRIPVNIGPTLHRAVHDVASRSGCTVFMVVHAALAVVLNQRRAATDIVIGGVSAGRSDGTLDDLVGFFVNTLALRTDLSGDPTLGEILQRVRETDLHAMEHQELPFDWVVELMQPTRTMAYNPLVQIMLGFQVGWPEPPQMHGLDTEIEQLDLKATAFDLTFVLTECFDHSGGHDGIRGGLEFATDLFVPATARAIVQELCEVLQAIAEDPVRRMTRAAQTALSA